MLLPPGWPFAAAAAADQRISVGGHRAGAGSGLQQQQKQQADGLEDRGIVVVGASVIPLTLAQREQLGE